MFDQDLPRVVLTFPKLVRPAGEHVKAINLGLEAELQRNACQQAKFQHSSQHDAYCLAKIASSIAPPHVDGLRMVRIYSSRGRLQGL